MGDKENFIDKTILTTPKPTAASTINRKTFKEKVVLPDSFPFVTKDSLGSTISGLNFSSITDKLSLESESNKINALLKEQHSLANKSLQRANKVAGIPSKYFKPNYTETASENHLNITDNSSINDSGLLFHAKNTSTPRESLSNTPDDNFKLPRPSVGESMKQLSHKIEKTNISIDNFVEEFKKTMSRSSIQNKSKLFTPAEEAESMLLADELSWRRQNEFSIRENDFSQTRFNDKSGKLSMSAFFQQKSDNISDLQSTFGGEQLKPVPLIDSISEEPSHYPDETNPLSFQTNSSLSVSTIQRFLSDAQASPKTLVDQLLNHGKKSKLNLSEQDLPVSKDSSYTSNYSENNALHHIVEDKENINSSNITVESRKQNTGAIRKSSLIPSSRSSTRTSSALTSLPNGLLPVETTTAGLIWGCVRVGKCVTQDFLLRNKSSKRLCFQMIISGHEFKIRKDCRPDSDSLTSVKIVLHPHESKPIFVSFIPTRTGAAVDQLHFVSIGSNMIQTEKQFVPLFGYGGFARIEPSNLTKDVMGKFWLSLGKMDGLNNLKQSFTLKNTGNLPAFAFVTFYAKNLYNFDNVTIDPSLLVLLPDESKEIFVTYFPTTEDYKALQQAIYSTVIIDIGNLIIISGSEVNRGRLRKQCAKCVESGLEIDPTSDLLKGTIVGEAMPADLFKFRENASDLKQILKLFSRSDVAMTLELDLEQTLLPQYPDDSAMFHSLCKDTILSLDSTTVTSSIKLEPSNLIFTPPTKLNDVLFLTSNLDKNLKFHVKSEPKGLDFSPTTGIISPRKACFVNVRCTKELTNRNRAFKILVYVDKDVFEVDVKVVLL